MEPQEKLLIARAADALERSGRFYNLNAVGFLNPHEAALIKREVHGTPDVRCEFFGGYEEAERRMFFSYPVFSEPDFGEFITAVRLTGRDISSLSHRDFLGSLMGLGIKRENVGDIVPCGDECLIFLKPKMAEYLTLNLTKIGRCGINAKVCGLGGISLPKRETESKAASVSSLRLDCIVAAAVNMSRSRAAELIKAESVSLNFEPALSVSKAVESGDVISVRKHGRFRLAEIKGRTRKGRISVIIEKYI